MVLKGLRRFHGREKNYIMILQIQVSENWKITLKESLKYYQVVLMEWKKNFEAFGKYYAEQVLEMKTGFTC